jgi:tetratricopeptide (TPR) repeat protein
MHLLAHLVARQPSPAHIQAMRKLVVALACAWLPFASPAPAQQSVDLLPPKLDKGADPNDWEAFYDYGVRMLTRMPSQANAAFYWAERKDPTRAEPIFGQWAAFWMLDFSEWPDYLQGSPRVLQDPKVRAADSLRYRSWERNPFVNQALWMVITNKLPGEWNTYPYTRGWIEYTNQHYALAIDNFTVSLGSGDQYYWRRYDIALVYTQVGRYDSAAAQMELLLATMRKQDRKSLIYFYQSKAMYEYALGLLYMAQGKFGDAREAQARAIQEDLAFAPAHAALGRIAAIRRDTATAVSEYATAVELAPRDGAMRYWYGGALLRAMRPVEGAEQLRQAVRLEPYFADSYMALGSAYESLADTAKAVAAYGDFIKWAPKRYADNVARAQSRLAALGAKTSP